MFQKKDKARLYRFGNSLREAIIEGCAKETRLRKEFEAIFLQKTGIQLLYSDLDFDITPTQPTLFWNTTNPKIFFDCSI